MNDCLIAVVEELRAAGVPYNVDMSRKHIRVRFGRNFEKVRIVSRTPSDWRAAKNERAGVRRALVEMEASR